MQNKKKVGIITLSASDNCGSLLQAYALQEVIRTRYKVEVEVINFESEKSKQVYDIFPNKFWLHPKRTLFMLRYYKQIKAQKKDYENFRKKQLILSENKYSCSEEIKKNDDEYEIIIAGSDQIWNINMSDYDDAFMLPWKSKARKISYAPSLGATLSLSCDKEDSIRDWLLDFDFLSIREQTGKNTLESFLNKEIDVVADPTLLLNFERWYELAGEREIKEEYAFFYSWSYPNEDLNEIAGRYSRENNIPVYVINQSKWYKYQPSKFGLILYKNSGPLAFLNLMKYAKFAFVQSFHGLVFANIFKKNFAFLCESEMVDFRIEQLIELLDEKDCIVRRYEELNPLLDKSREYTSTEFDNFLKSSMDFLDKAMKG